MTSKPRSVSKSRSKRPSTNSTSLVIIAVGVIILIISLISFFRPSESTGIEQPRLNTRMSNFEAADLNGNWVSLDDYAGYVILINTWATWCPPCKAEMPDLNAFYKKYQNQGFVVLAINAGEAPATAQSFSDEYHLDFPVLVDPDYRLMDALKISAYPTSILVDRDGIVRSIRVGMHTPQTLTDEVLPLLGD